MRKLLVVVLLTLSANAATLIHAGRVLDVATGKYATDQGILIEGDRIKAVGPFAEMKDVPVIDLRKYTILPGLADCHAHILGNLKDFSAASSFRMSAPMQAIFGVHNLQQWLDHGFTTLRDAGEIDTAYGQFALRDAVNQGLITGPRIFAAGGLVSVTGGHGDADFFSADQSLARRPNIANTVDEMADAVRRDLKFGADWIKLMATGGILDPYSDFSKQELSEEQMAKAVELAHRAGRRVMAHAEGTEGIKAAVRAGVDSIEHGTMLDDEGAALMEQHHTWLVPTLWTFQFGAKLGEKLGVEPVSMAKVRRILSAQQPAFDRARAHHLRIAFGLDLPPDELPSEFSALVRSGLTPLQALQAATINAAELLGQSENLGTIAPGKFADVIAVDGDPLANIEVMQHVPFVMKGGAIVKEETK